MIVRLLGCVVILLFSEHVFSQCGGLDIFIANDQSGSVDAQENIKSREFITSFAQTLPLSNTSGGFRIAIADWDYNGGWVPYNFPIAGKEYTTNFSDILHYASAPRVLFNGTDLVMALQQSYVSVLQDQTDRPKVILLMTDALMGNIQPALTELATQVKASGVYVVILSVSTPFSTVLADAASPGGYFTADSYDQLANEAASFTAAIGAAACVNSAPSFDLGIKLTGFNAENCFPGPGSYELKYEIKNYGKEAWNNAATISLYNGDLYSYGTSLISVFKTDQFTLQPGETYKGTYLASNLEHYSILNAIVNFDGKRNPISIPVYPFELYPLLEVQGERSPINNYSNLINRTNGRNCVPIANVKISVLPDDNGCGNTAGYGVNICNTGTQDTRITGFKPIAGNGFALVHADTHLDSTRTGFENTYFGGLNTDYAYSATTDPFGAIYMSGQTNSSNNIATSGAYRTSNGGTQDAFLSKFDAEGKRLWATYFGGTGPENGYSVTTDKEGNVYLTGETSISTNIATAGAHQLVNGGSYDAFLAKFSSNGGLLWSTYYGGSGADYGRSVITDNDGNVYMAGITASTNNIATSGAHQATLGGSNDAFLVKFNSDGVRQWATYYGGTGTESGFGVVTDAQNNVYLTGLTGSTGNISTTGSYQAVKAAGNDAYLVKFNSNGVRQWGTFFGGNNSDNATAIAIDGENRIYIAGNTASTNLTTPNAFQQANGGGTDAFLASFNADGNLQWATCYGGTGTENGRHIHAGLDGYIYLSGTTASTTGIATTGSIQEVYGGNTDAFLVKFNKSGQREWGTYFGGSESDVASAAVTDALGKIYLAGATMSTGLGTRGVYQPNYGGGSNDAFLMSVDEKASFILKAGNCVDLHYYYDVSRAVAGTYDFSFLLSAEKLYASDPEPVIEPEGEGFIGASETSDDVTINHQSPACQPGDKLTTAITIPPVTICGDATYVTATITIHNNSGSTIKQSSLHLELSGTNARFASELYGASDHFRYARPDVINALYPESQYALVNKSGSIDIPLYEIPAGTSIVRADISVNGSDLVMSAQLTGISTFLNASGVSNISLSQHAVTLSPLPEITGWNYPETVNPGETLSFNNLTVTNAASLLWVSATEGQLKNEGSLQQPTLSYGPTAKDIAKGYVQLSLTVLNNAGCDVSKVANVTIKGVEYDYGDAAATYDFLTSSIPTAAGATLLDGLYLGQRSPSWEPAAKSGIEADGDGIEEDGLAEKCPLQPVPGSQYQLLVTITNRSGKDGFVNGFIDWNNDGDFMDEGETALTAGKLKAQSGEGNFYLSFKCPSTIVSAGRYLVRLKLSTDSASVTKSYGPSPEGEIEDHWMVIKDKKVTYQQHSICKGGSYTVGNHIYTKAGTYTDTIAMTTGCDSIIHTTITIDECGENICGPFIPSAFTPNSDGKNDGFGAVMRCAVAQFRLTIYNRWGQKIFETTNPAERWNGRVNGILQAAGVFAWLCTYKLNDSIQNKKGTVTLIR